MLKKTKTKVTKKMRYAKERKTLTGRRKKINTRCLEFFPGGTDNKHKTKKCKQKRNLSFFL